MASSVSSIGHDYINNSIFIMDDESAEIELVSDK